MCKGKHSAPYVISLIRKWIAEVRMQEDTRFGVSKKRSGARAPFSYKMVVLSQHAFGNGIVPLGNSDFVVAGGVFPF